MEKGSVGEIKFKKKSYFLFKSILGFKSDFSVIYGYLVVFDVYVHNYN